MLIPSQLAAMKLGIRAGWQPAPVRPRDAAPSVPPARSRIVSAARIAGDNENLSDCFPTACANAVAALIANGAPGSVSTADAILAYQGMAGYQPGNPATDAGTNPDDGFDWWEHNQIAGFRLAGVSQISAQSEADIRHAICGGGILLCLALSVENQNERVLYPNGRPGSWGYHAVWMDGYDGAITSGTSWGNPFYLDRTYFDGGFVTAAYALDILAL